VSPLRAVRVRYVSRDALDSAGFAGALPLPSVTRLLTSPLSGEPETVFHRRSRPWARGSRSNGPTLRQDNSASIRPHATGNELNQADLP
jgi:hypothetical protein